MEKHAKINEAISAVMGEVRVLQKGDQNKHDNYAFASIDKFLEVVGTACAKHGLIIFQDEVETEFLQLANKRGEQQNWLRAKYEFWLSHKSGEYMEKPFVRSVMVRATGGQAFGSAQSYTLKQFQRSLFQIATGDKDDVDFQEAEDVDVSKMTPTEKKKAGLWKGPLAVTALKNKMRDLSAALKDPATQDTVEAIKQEYADVLEQAAVDLPDWYEGADKAIEQALKDALPEAPEPEVSDYTVPVGTNGNGADWDGWCKNMIKLIEGADSLVAVNEICDANLAALENFRDFNAQDAGMLEQMVENRRDVLAQAPA